MQNTKIKFGIFILVILVAGGIFIVARSPSAPNTDTPQTSAPHETINPSASTPTTSAPHETIKPTPSPTPKPAPSEPTVKTYTMAEIATHNNEQSCWTMIRGNVYDLTSWIGEHPGGARAILSLCGGDGTQAFVDQHGGQGRPETELKSFFIGNLN